MSQYDEYDEQEQQESSGMKQLREALEKANKSKTAVERQLAEALEKITSLEKHQKAAALTDLLKAKGVDPKYAKWAQKDDVEASDTAVEAWLKENEGLIPVSTPGESPAGTPENQSAQTGNQGDPFAGLPPEVQAALAAMRGTQTLETEGAAPAHFDPRAEVAVEHGLAAIAQNAKSEEDILAALKALGAPMSGF